MKTKKVKVTIKIGGNKRKGSCWSKVVTGIDNSKKDGHMFIGEFLSDGEFLLEPRSVILQVETHGSWKNMKFLAFLGIVETDGSITWQEDFDGISWKLKKVSLAEKCSELLENSSEKTEDNFENVTYQISHEQYLQLLMNFTNYCGWYSKMVIIKKNEFDFLKYPFHSDCFELFNEEEYNSLMEICQEDEMITVTEVFHSKNELIQLIQDKMNLYQAKNEILFDDYYSHLEYQNLYLLLEIIEQRK